MKTKTVLVSEDGKILTNESDGFIIQGNIYVSDLKEDGQPNGGLIGNSFPDDIDKSKVKLLCYTKKDFLRALGYTWEELQQITEEMMPHTRSNDDFFNKN